MSNPELEAVGVHLIDMDPLVHEQVVLNEDGSYSIFINARLNYESQLKAYAHALLHILNDDFEKMDVDAVEQQAHAM